MRAGSPSRSRPDIGGMRRHSQSADPARFLTAGLAAVGVCLVLGASLVSVGRSREAVVASPALTASATPTRSPSPTPTPTPTFELGPLTTVELSAGVPLQIPSSWTPQIEGGTDLAFALPATKGSAPTVTFDDLGEMTAITEEILAATATSLAAAGEKPSAPAVGPDGVGRISVPRTSGGSVEAWVFTVAGHGVLLTLTLAAPDLTAGTSVEQTVAAQLP